MVYGYKFVLQISAYQYLCPIQNSTSIRVSKGCEICVPDWGQRNLLSYYFFKQLQLRGIHCPERMRQNLFNAERLNIKTKTKIIKVFKIGFQLCNFVFQPHRKGKKAVIHAQSWLVPVSYLAVDSRGVLPVLFLQGSPTPGGRVVFPLNSLLSLLCYSFISTCFLFLLSHLLCTLPGRVPSQIPQEIDICQFLFPTGGGESGISIRSALFLR